MEYVPPFYDNKYSGVAKLKINFFATAHFSPRLVSNMLRITSLISIPGAQGRPGPSPSSPARHLMLKAFKGSHTRLFNGLEKAESCMLIQACAGRTGLRAFLFRRRASGVHTRLLAHAGPARKPLSLFCRMPRFLAQPGHANLAFEIKHRFRRPSRISPTAEPVKAGKPFRGVLGRWHG